MDIHNNSSFPARYWHLLDDGRVQCDLCPRYCKLKDEQRGFCFVRMNEGKKLVLTTYGRSSGFCVDPIEKKPLNHFYPGTSILSFGTAGCNLGCKFCQNWDISKSRMMDRLADYASPEQIAQSAKRMNCPSVAFTYNDPVIFLEYAVDIAKECHKQGIYTAAVTAGYICEEPRTEFFSHMDAANVDLKGFTEEFYRDWCMGQLQPVLDTLVYLKKKTQCWVEITTLLIPTLNDSEDELHKLTEWVFKNLGADTPIHFTAFHPDFQVTNLPPTPVKTLKTAREIAMSKGIRYVYTGNVYDPTGSSTYCPQCKKLIIERDYYNIGEYHIKDGKCGYCLFPIAGHFADTPGSWAGKRMAVKV
jgi:pyruvate formate lyase activating enzyme